MDNRKQSFEGLLVHARIVFSVLLLIAVYEVWYLFAYGSGLSLVLAALSGAATYLSYIVIKTLDNIE